MGMAYDKGVALDGCSLIELLYDMIDKWEAAGRSKEGSFHWTPPADIQAFTSYSSLIWSEAKTYRRQPGPKVRYRWVKERSPMIVLAMGANGVLYIGVRGTSTDLEWASNMRFIPVSLKIGALDMGHVHEGFGDTFRSCEKSFSQVLADFAGKEKNIRAVVVAGHSLGAAVATLVSVSLIQSDWFKASGFGSSSVYLLGSPNVGQSDFVTVFNEMPAHEVFNIRNTCDLVPKVPPEELGFHPVNTLMKFTKDWGNLRDNHVMPIYRAAITEGWV